MHLYFCMYDSCVLVLVSRDCVVILYTAQECVQCSGRKATAAAARKWMWSMEWSACGMGNVMYILWSSDSTLHISSLIIFPSQLSSLLLDKICQLYSNQLLRKILSLRMIAKWWRLYKKISKKCTKL